MFTIIAFGAVNNISHENILLQEQINKTVTIGKKAAVHSFKFSRLNFIYAGGGCGGLLGDVA
ncbi:MAG: hypothetical protein ABNG99_08815 [Thalassolituus sp.]|jgi:hypothetical protein